MNTERNIELLKFIKERLVSVYGEHPNTDFVLGLDRVINEITSDHDALAQKLRAAQHDAEALTATVEALRNLLDNVRRSEEFIVDHAIMLGVDCDLADEIDATLAATPQQHLLELRAEAIEDALDYMLSNTSSGNSASDDFDLIRGYADSVRRGE